MHSDAARWLRIIGWFVVIAYTAFAVFDFVVADDPLGNRAIVAGLLVIGAAFVALGLRMFSQRPWPAAGLVGVGAVMGAFPIFWSVLAPLLAITLVVLSVVCARRASLAKA